MDIFLKQLLKRFNSIINRYYLKKAEKMKRGTAKA